MKSEIIPNKLHHNAVIKAFVECAIPNGKRVKKDSIIVDGVSGPQAFRKDILETHRTNVKMMLAELPPKYFTSGGATFNDLWDHSDGTRWTGTLSVMDMLLMLGLALGYVQYILPRDLWVTLPGRLPWLSINLEK